MLYQLHRLCDKIMDNKFNGICREVVLSFLTFVDPCIIVQFIKKNPTRCNNVSNGTMCLTMSTSHTSNNLPRMKHQRLPVQF